MFKNSSDISLIFIKTDFAYFIPSQFYGSRFFSDKVMLPVHKVKVKKKAIHSHNSENLCNYYLEGISALPFIAALFTIVKVWKQPKCPSVNESRKCHTHTQRNMIQPDYEGNPTICNSMDEPRRNYAEWRKPDREVQLLHGITFVQDLFF